MVGNSTRSLPSRPTRFMTVVSSLPVQVFHTSHFQLPVASPSIPMIEGGIAEVCSFNTHNLPQLRSSLRSHTRAVVSPMAPQPMRGGLGFVTRSLNLKVDMTQSEPGFRTIKVCFPAGMVT